MLARVCLGPSQLSQFALIVVVVVVFLLLLLMLLLLSLFIDSYCMHHNHTDVGKSVGVLLQGDPHVPEGVDEPCDVTPVPPLRVHQGRQLGKQRALLAGGAKVQGQ